MKVDKIRNLTDVELNNQEHELADQLFKLKFQLNMGQTESLKKIRGLRKDIARVKTIVGERGRGGRSGEKIMAETTATAKVQGRRKEVVGEVVANRMQKTIVVKVTRKKAHPFYGRVVARNKKFYAHDEKNEAHVGDVVRIRGDASAFEAEALEAEGHCAQDGAGAGSRSEVASIRKRRKRHFRNRAARSGPSAGKTRLPQDDKARGRLKPWL